MDNGIGRWISKHAVINADRIALKYGEVAGRNPWGSRGYEWDVPSPPPTGNFDQVPVFTRGPHEYQDVPEELAKVGHAL